MAIGDGERVITWRHRSHSFVPAALDTNDVALPGEFAQTRRDLCLGDGDAPRVEFGGQEWGTDASTYRLIRKRINEIGEQYRILEVAADRLFQGAQLCQYLADDGFDVVPFGQGFLSMAAPTQEFERLVNRGVLHHGDNPVVRWMASNVSVKIDPAGNMKPDKSRSAEKIDGIVAAIMALGRAMAKEGVEEESVYSKRGVLWI